MSAGYDAEVAELFRDLRTASNLTEADLAAQLATQTEVVLALEQGALYALPPWPETCRVVNAYGTLLNLDTRPLLRRIYAQLEAGIVELGPKAVPEVPVMAPQGGHEIGFAAGNAGNSAAPSPQARPQAPWPNGPPSPQPQQQPAPQAPWPVGASSFRQQGAWAGGQPMQQASQAPWPNDPQGAPLQPQAGRRPQLRQAQPQPVQPRPQRHPQPQRSPQQPTAQRYAPQPQAAPQAVQDAFMGDVDVAPPAPKKRLGLLKWGLGALVASAIGFGLWMALGHWTHMTGKVTSGASDTSNPVLDPDDPRSRKADRLPSKFPEN